jgi:hypothetical protein
MFFAPYFSSSIDLEVIIRWHRGHSTCISSSSSSTPPHAREPLRVLEERASSETTVVSAVYFFIPVLHLIGRRITQTTPNTNANANNAINSFILIVIIFATSYPVLLAVPAFRKIFLRLS